MSVSSVTNKVELYLQKLPALFLGVAEERTASVDFGRRPTGKHKKVQANLIASRGNPLGLDIVESSRSPKKPERHRRRERHLGRYFLI